VRAIREELTDEGQLTRAELVEGIGRRGVRIAPIARQATPARTSFVGLRSKELSASAQTVMVKRHTYSPRIGELPCIVDLGRMR
jgi:hypothetical protein